MRTHGQVHALSGAIDSEADRALQPKPISAAMAMATGAVSGARQEETAVLRTAAVCIKGNLVLGRSTSHRCRTLPPVA